MKISKKNCSPFENAYVVLCFVVAIMIVGSVAYVVGELLGGKNAPIDTRVSLNAAMLINQRLLDERDMGILDGPLRRLGQDAVAQPLLAERYPGGGYCLLVANEEKRKAFLVFGPPSRVFVSRDFPVTGGRFGSDVLGLPVVDSPNGDIGQQEFEKGTLIWNKKNFQYDFQILPK